MTASLNQLSPAIDIVTADRDSTLGVFVGFVTTDDPHSPVVLHHYDEVHDHFHGAIPLLLVDARGLEDSGILDLCSIFSVPTLVWMHYLDWDTTPTVYTRHVGTTTAKKIIADVEAKLETLLPE